MTPPLTLLLKAFSLSTGSMGLGNISHIDGSHTHISLLHQPLSLRCIQPVGLSQESFLKGLPVNLNRMERSRAGRRLFHLDSKNGSFFFSLPADPTACQADSAVGCGLLSPRCAPAQSAPGCHRLCASALPCRQQCGFGRVPGPCPCSTHRNKLCATVLVVVFFSHCVRSTTVYRKMSVGLFFLIQVHSIGLKNKNKNIPL